MTVSRNLIATPRGRLNRERHDNVASTKGDRARMNGSTTIGEQSDEYRPEHSARSRRLGDGAIARATIQGDQARPVSVNRATSLPMLASGWALIRPHWPLLLTFALYAVAASAIVPTMAPVAISDDWTYARSVELLVNDGRLEVLPVAAATVIFQALWGGLFATLFGMSFGALRLSTVVLTALSGWACYGLCRELGVSRGRSALGAAAYLFNPLAYALAFTFMSDPHFTALLTITTFWYTRGLQPHAPRNHAIWLGSGAAALAFLVRPHGALIPAAVVLWLLLSRRVRWNGASLALVFRIAAVPATVAMAYYGWYAWDRGGMPSQQGLFLSEARAAGWGESWLLIRRLTFIEMMYAAFFAFPIAAAAVPRLRQLARETVGRGWLLFAGWQAVILVGVGVFWGQGRTMPYVPHFLGRAGPGSGDLRAARPPLAGPWFFEWATWLCAASALIVALLFARQLHTRRGSRKGSIDHPVDRTRAITGLVVTIGLIQIVGVIPQSLLFRNWTISLDRYLLPLLPFSICLTLWALRDVRLHLGAAWVVTGLFALVAVAGTRDALVFQDRVWAYARYANANGVENTRLDAGYAWDAYHLWEYSQANGIPPQANTGTWWTDVYAPATDSTYAIAGGPVEGYDAVSFIEYSSWLQHDPVYLYLMRRQGVPGPP